MSILVTISLFREEIKANEEPFEKERGLVTTLIVYCQKLVPPDSLGGEEDCKNSEFSSPLGKTQNPPENCTVYRKNYEEDVLFAGIKRNIGSAKKSAKKTKVSK